MTLNTNRKDMPYLFGRLFAVIDRALYNPTTKTGLTATQLGQASLTPLAMLGILGRLSLSKIQKSARYEHLIREIISEIDTNSIPEYLSTEDQGAYFLGFYAQQGELWKSKKYDTIEENDED
jgi:CRISPR-associated protein Csd1